jgi:sulfur carrier protein
MKILVNGEQYEHNGQGTIVALLKKMKINENRVAIMVNDKVVNRNERKSVRLKDGDRVELLTFAGGG